MREYSLNSQITAALAQSGLCTLLFLNPAAAPSANLELLRIWAGQTANATSAQQRVQMETQVTAFPTLTSKAPNKLKQSDPASLITGGTSGAAGTSGVNASAEGAGAKTVVFEDQFNVLNGYLWVPTPRETMILQAGTSSGFGVFFPVAPASASQWGFGLNFGEV